MTPGHIPSRLRLHQKIIDCVCFELHRFWHCLTSRSRAELNHDPVEPVCALLFEPSGAKMATETLAIHGAVTIRYKMYSTCQTRSTMPALALLCPVVLACSGIFSHILLDVISKKIECSMPNTTGSLFRACLSPHLSFRGLICRVVRLCNDRTMMVGHGRLQSIAASTLFSRPACYA